MTAGEVENVLEGGGQGEHAGAVRGYAEVIRLFMAHGSDLPFAESQIKYLQSLLLRHDAESDGARRRYRDGHRPPRVGGGWWATGPVSPRQDIAGEMAELVSWSRETLDSQALHPLLVCGLFLGRFMAIRPFAIGNTRLVFALAVYFLDRYGYSHVRVTPFEEVLDEGRESAAEALLALGGDRDDAGPWIRWFLAAVAASQDRALAVVAARPDIAPKDEAVAPAVQVGAGGLERLHPRAERILAAMRERGAAKIGELLPVVGAPRATVKKDLRALVDAGRLVTRGVRKGTVYYVVE